MAIPDVFSWVNAQIKDCISKGEGNDEKRALAEKLIKVLLDNNLATLELLQHHKVAIHPDNRDHTGVDPLDVHELLSRICKDGFAADELGVRWSFEKSHAGDEATLQMNFNHMLAQASDGLLPVPSWDDVDVLAVASTHTVTGFNAAEAGVRGIHDALCVNGCLSKGKIIQQYPSMKQPFDVGFNWIKIRWSVQERCPLLPSFLSDAANKSHGVHRVSTMVQNLFKLHAAGKRNQSTQGSPMWASVAKQFDARHSGGTATDMCAFVDKWAGGVNPTMLHAIDAFNKMLRVKRTVPSKILGALATISLTSSPEYICACVKAMLCAPDGLHVNGVANIIGANEIQQIKTTKNAACVDAAERMRMGSKWLKDAVGVDENAFQKLLSNFEVITTTTVTTTTTTNYYYDYDYDYYYDYQHYY